MPRFRSTIICVIEYNLNQEVIDGVLNEEWWSQFYRSVNTPEAVADMVADNYIRNNTRISHLDGFADREDSDFQLIGQPDWDCETELVI